MKGKIDLWMYELIFIMRINVINTALTKFLGVEHFGSNLTTLKGEQRSFLAAADYIKLIKMVDLDWHLLCAKREYSNRQTFKAQQQTVSCVF